MEQESLAKKASEVDLKAVFVDVNKGYTKLKTNILADGFAYIKHLTLFDNVKTDKLYDECLQKAKDNNLPTEKEQVEYLKKEELWTHKEDKKLQELTSYTGNLKSTKSKLFLKSQIEPINKEIRQNQIKIQSLQTQKDQLMGFTAEKYAAKRANEIYIKHALYRDAEFESKSITDDQFNEMSDDVLSALTSDYNKFTEHLTIENLKKISLMSFFCNYFYLCDDNPYTFYGKPVVDLTFYQAELFAYGRYFKNLASNAKALPPEEIRDDPDKMIEFYEMRSNADEVMDKLEQKSGDKSGATSLVGATKEDLEALGYKKGGGKTLDLMDVASEKGGQLSMDDFIDLHG